MGTSAKVLIAEQDQSVIRLLKTVLTNAGHRVVLAKTSEKAIEALGEYDIDIALIDAGLEGKAGLELAKKLKQDHPDVVTALLTYFGSKRSALASTDAGVERFILKPFDDLASVSRTIKEIVVERVERLRRKSEVDVDDTQPGAATASPMVRVIVADATKEDREMIGTALERLRCAVTYATCAQEALLQLSKSEYEVLLVAYDMGDMTADDVLLRAKRLDQYLSVVVTSADPSLAVTTALIKKGASGFVEKPLKDPKRTAESVVQRGLAVVQLREEIAREQEAAEDEGTETKGHEEEEDENGVADGDQENGLEEATPEEPLRGLKPDNEFTLTDGEDGEDGEGGGEGEEDRDDAEGEEASGDGDGEPEGTAADSEPGDETDVPTEGDGAEEAASREDEPAEDEPAGEEEEEAKRDD